MSTNTKKSGARFNIFDILIILAILASIAAIGLRAYFLTGSQTQAQTTRIEFVVKGVSSVTAEAFCQQYSKLYLSDTDAEIGTLISATYDNAKLEAEDENGYIVIANHPEKLDIHGYANMSGTWTDDGFLIGGTVLATIGKTVSIYTPNAVCTITIVNVPNMP